MSIRAKVENGYIKLPDGVYLPDGMEVDIEPVPEKRGKSLADRYRKYIGIVKGAPSDLAENHDHYLYGTPKKTK